MTWLVAVPLIYSGFFLHSACVAPIEGRGVLVPALHAAGLTFATVGALVLIV